MILVPIRTGRGLNDRDGWRKRLRRVRSEKDATAWMLIKARRPALPCTVQLTRVAPSSGLDDDNLAGSLKAIRDAVATWLRVDDAKREVVRYAYVQRRGPWGVEIEFKEMKCA